MIIIMLIFYKYVEAENKKQKYWFVYFVDEIERNSFINSLKTTWELLFQVNFLKI